MDSVESNCVSLLSCPVFLGCRVFGDSFEVWCIDEFSFFVILEPHSFSVDVKLIIGDSIDSICVDS